MDKITFGINTCLLTLRNVIPIYFIGTIEMIKFEQRIR
jgi:hypothetical protein